MPGHAEPMIHHIGYYYILCRALPSTEQRTTSRVRRVLQKPAGGMQAMKADVGGECLGAENWLFCKHCDSPMAKAVLYMHGWDAA